ncbi:hypothetical protein GCM10010116_16520 [Microbispora rosea subsp. aerata]|nr:hypothetical protein [Microbispora rosea]GGO08167.1 hypothetical protein GCM10010116_16520 [Microbispora rosea subsp. aerata]GIH55464.1 hypothetical protein Mro02_23780 [Microbispora rosea subsp. aerata]GLJ84661.1 hypothetical protein GCM10017588_33890 [Microbispora rosea subsp. aerata]
MKRTLALGGVAAGLLASAAIASPAHADTPKDVAAKTLASTNFAAQQVAAYWFGERAANLIKATPYGVETKVIKSKVLAKVPSAPASTKPGIVGSSGDQKASTGNLKNVNLPRTVGKVFFIGADHKPHWCSATAVQGHYKNLVATAGHCVYDTVANKGTLDKWVFIPGYYQGKAPWGIYVGKTAYTHYDYSVYEDGDRDYAFVTVYNGVQVTGVSYDRYDLKGHSHKGHKSHHGRDDHRRGKGHHDRTYTERVSVREFKASNPGRDLTGNGPWAKGTSVKTIEISERAYDSHADSYVSRDGKTLYFRKKVWDRDDHRGPRHGDHRLRVQRDDLKPFTPNGGHHTPPSPTPSVSSTPTPSPSASPTASASPTPRPSYTPGGHHNRPKYKYYARTFYKTRVHHDHKPRAVLKIALKDVGTLGSNVGGQGLAYNQKVGSNVFMFGYPSGSEPDGNYQFTGQTMKWAYGKTFRTSASQIKGEELVGVKSSFTGEGSIGSPWLYRYSNAKRLGYLNGVTIGLADTDGNDRIDTSLSSYFDGETYEVYKVAEKNWSGKIV